MDKYDTKRAIEILRAVTGNKLRFAFDCVGKETAGFLQEVLQQSNTGGKKAHLLGLTGLPKERVANVVHHTVPIKVFHESSVVGEALMKWLEELLLVEALKLPDVEVAEGGLAGINDALDRLRNGSVSGKRIVVPVEVSRGSSSEPSTPPNGAAVATNGVHDADPLAYADKLNAEPDRLKFAYWVGQACKIENFI